MALTAGLFRDALAAAGAVGGQIMSFADLAAGANDALRQAPPGLTSAGAAAFLATMGEESAHFRTTTEYGHGQRYAPWIGRTFEQLTWQGAYRGFGQWLQARDLVFDSEVFIKNPGALSDLRWAWLGGVYYWEVHGLWPVANAGDFAAVSRAVNGGDGRLHDTSWTPNGWAERLAMYRVFAAVGPALLPDGSAPEDDDMPLQYIPLSGSGSITVPWPVGTASAVIAHGCMSVIANEDPVKVQCWPQTDGGGIKGDGGPQAPNAQGEWDATATVGPGGFSSRPLLAFPSGHTRTKVHYQCGASGGGLLLEGWK